FKPGDNIAFKSGQRFIGVLAISSSGKQNAPIVYTTYDGNEPAVIDGSGDSVAIYIYNQQHLELKNLAVTNYRKGTLGVTDLFNGIYIVNEDAGTLHHFHFDRIRVFDVNSTHIAKDEGKTDQSRFHGGVQVYTRGNKVQSNFNDVLITNSTFENLSRTGFNFRSDWDDRAAYSKFGDSIGKGLTDNWIPNTNVVFRKNVFKNIAGNGLIVRVAKDALIEHNLFDSCGKIISGNAVFNFNTDSTIYQFNEAKNTIYNEGDTDARGIDSDYRTKNTIIQYNYLHNNQLGGVTATGGPGVGDNPVNFNIGTIIRYNIIENNARQGAYFSGRVEGLQVYNNVFYADSNYKDVVVLKLNRWTVYPNGASFRNNIFYYKGSNPTYSFGSSTNVSFDHNIYYGVKPPVEFADKFPITEHPKFINAGIGKDGYRLKAGSPAIKSGIIIGDNGNRDYYGNMLSKNAKPNIGIYDGDIKK
ncbi:MAG: right-handed parallel beta-helix repeat-containing protein, partial [Segetibacter sp.]